MLPLTPSLLQADSPPPWCRPQTTPMILDLPQTDGGTFTSAPLPCSLSAPRQSAPQPELTACPLSKPMAPLKATLSSRKGILTCLLSPQSATLPLPEI